MLRLPSLAEDPPWCKQGLRVQKEEPSFANAQLPSRHVQRDLWTCCQVEEHIQLPLGKLSEKFSLGKSHLTIINILGRCLSKIFSNLSGTPHRALTVFLLLAVAVAVPDELAG